MKFLYSLLVLSVCVSLAACSPFEVKKDEGEVGDSCSSSDPCIESLDCVSGTCIPQDQGGDGQPCYEDICRDGLVCQNGTCNPDSTCDPACDSSQCLVCDNGNCVSSCTTGQVCDNGNCVADNTCDPACDSSQCMVCNNGSCESSCVSGQVCDNGTCVADNTCNPACDASQCLVCNNGNCQSSCIGDQTCQNGTCVGGLTAGQPCDPTDDQCASGFYCLDRGGASLCSNDAEGQLDEPCFTHQGSDFCGGAWVCLYNPGGDNICAESGDGVEGLSCYSGSYCQTGLTCDNNTCVDDTGLAEGQPCNPDASDCLNFLFCLPLGTGNAVCAANGYGLEGEACYTFSGVGTNLCHEGHTCLFDESDGTMCAEEGAGEEGANCFEMAFCIERLACENNVCIDPTLGQEGDSCGTDSDCVNGLYCLNGNYCAPAGLGHFGESCWNWGGADYCDSTLSCKFVNSQLYCVPDNQGDSTQQCITGAGFSDDCVDDLNCVNDICTSGGTNDVGESCTGAGDCLTGLRCLATDSGSYCAGQNEGDYTDPCVSVGDHCASGLTCRELPALMAKICVGGEAVEGAVCYQDSYCVEQLMCEDFDGQRTCIPLNVGHGNEDCYMGLCADNMGLECTDLTNMTPLCLPAGTATQDTPCYGGECREGSNLNCREIGTQGEMCVQGGTGLEGQPCFLGECTDPSILECRTLYPEALEQCIPNTAGDQDEGCYNGRCTDPSLDCIDFTSYGQRCVPDSQTDGQLNEPCYEGQCINGLNLSCNQMDDGVNRCIDPNVGFNGQPCIDDTCVMNSHCLLGHNLCVPADQGYQDQDCYNDGQDDYCTSGLVCLNGVCSTPICQVINSPGFGPTMDVAVNFDWTGDALYVAHGGSNSGGRICRIADYNASPFTPVCANLADTGAVDGFVESIAMNDGRLAVAGDDGNNNKFLDILSSYEFYGPVGNILSYDLAAVDVGHNNLNIALVELDPSTGDPSLGLLDGLGDTIFGNFQFVCTGCWTNDVVAMPNRDGAAMGGHDSSGGFGVLAAYEHDQGTGHYKQLIGVDTTGVEYVNALEFGLFNNFLAVALTDFAGNNQIWLYDTSTIGPDNWTVMAKLTLGDLLMDGEYIVDLEFSDGDEMLLVQTRYPVNGNSRTLFFRMIPNSWEWQLYYLGQRQFNTMGRMDYDGDYFAISEVDLVTVCDAHRMTRDNFGLGISCGSNADCSGDYECREFTINNNNFNAKFCSLNCADASECGGTPGWVDCIPDIYGASACIPKSVPDQVFKDTFYDGVLNDQVCDANVWQFDEFCDAIYSVGGGNLFGTSMKIFAGAQGLVWVPIDSGLASADFRVEALLDQWVINQNQDVVGMVIGPTPVNGGSSDSVGVGHFPAQCTTTTDKWNAFHSDGTNSSCEDGNGVLGDRISGGPIHLMIEVFHSRDEANFCVDGMCRSVWMNGWNLVPEALWFPLNPSSDYYVDNVTISRLP